jgi:N-acetylmuramoyl-L-alanine amidase
VTNRKLSYRGLLVWVVTFGLIFVLPIMAHAGVSLKIVYPKPGQVVTAVDSTFIFGSVSDGYDGLTDRVEINGVEVPVHKKGGFLAFLPVTPGDFEFHVRVFRQRQLALVHSQMEQSQLLAEDSVRVSIPKPRRSLPEDTLAIVGDYNPPSGDLVLSTGDVFNVMFQGTPQMFAWFSIPGVIDSVPMSETDPREQPYWGQAVFGAGAVPDTMLLKGVYSGVYIVPESVSVIDARVVYHLATPSERYIRPLTDSLKPVADSDSLLQLVAVPDSVQKEAGYKISLNNPDYPFTVRFLDSVQTLRYGPRLGYFAIFQPAGVEALVVGAEGDWYRARLSRSQYAWIDRKAVMPLPRGILPPQSRPTTVRTYGRDDGLLIEIVLSGQHPFRVFEDNTRTLRLQLFGVTSNTDWIRYDFADSLVDLATWSQPEDGLYEIKIALTEDLWGYDTYYEGNTFYLKLKRPPERVGDVWGKTIVLDPGHASDPGAIGPTGLTEAEANLKIALTLRNELAKRGAHVVMTREDMHHVGLNERPVIAKLADADLFVSIHNNALPDGVNPFVNHGVSTYYYHPHSARLARSIQKELLTATGLPDFGFYNANLAVDRATQYPAVLVECAFMMIPEQEAMLQTEAFRNRLAHAIADGIGEFLKDYARSND